MLQNFLKGRRDIARHRAWMMRGYAIALGAGTQGLTGLPYYLFESLQSELVRALTMGAGWAINLAVAEWIIRKGLAHPVRTPTTVFESRRTAGATEVQ